ncbi:MAG: hypothetical protein DSM106950_10790 [Stigonema ocellatum SAG 48.90 = DSM 106950]|nr:hypothetical protein [Stigonema ocellatum SAG 48.90 = DSM 106950]
MSNPIPEDYRNLLVEVKQRIRSAQYEALKESKKPIGVASYQIVSSVPQGLKNQLTEPEQVANLLEKVDND